ncbi:hypothetical protein AGLY_010654 [Aphis glycines]|uniref:Uncharacterized protein n=1 Tax=Aphis glycines TaxID=307491 RepID=A0A6G0TEK6_APHGL|nr:hypothetical protein AGLY_010654 [Aphis glycines]
MTEASLKRQSGLLILAFMNGITCGTILLWQQVANNIIQTPADLHGFQSSSSSPSSCLVSFSIKTGIMNSNAPSAYNITSSSAMLDQNSIPCKASSSKSDLIACSWQPDKHGYLVGSFHEQWPSELEDSLRTSDEFGSVTFAANKAIRPGQSNIGNALSSGTRPTFRAKCFKNVFFNKKTVLFSERQPTLFHLNLNCFIF